MQQWDIDISANQSRSLDQFRNQDFDLVLTVCDNAEDPCPVLPGTTQTPHWPFDDLPDATGSEDGQMVVFRRVRDEIEEAILSFRMTETDWSSSEG
jgi:arsenate reductase